jgi:hypothetical protein
MVGIALGDVENHTALHYEAVQTQYIKGTDGDSLRLYYAGIIAKRAKELLKISKYMVFDAYFSKKSIRRWFGRARIYYDKPFTVELLFTLCLQGSTKRWTRQTKSL